MNNRKSISFFILAMLIVHGFAFVTGQAQEVSSRYDETQLPSNKSKLQEVEQRLIKIEQQLKLILSAVSKERVLTKDQAASEDVSKENKKVRTFISERHVFEIETHDRFYGLPSFTGKVTKYEILKDAKATGEDVQFFKVFIETESEILVLDDFACLKGSEKVLEGLVKQGAVVLPETISDLRSSILTD